MMFPGSLGPGIQSQPNGMSNCPSYSQRPVRLVEPTDYSIPEPIDWGVCQLPDYEIERQIREKREQEQRDKDRKEKDRISRLRKEERRRALRPQGPPPHNTEHKAGLPCEECDPHLQHEKPWYPPTDYDKPLERSPLCPVMDPRCPASFVPGAVGGGGYGAGGGYAPCANGGMDMGMGMGMGMGMPSMGSQCPATAYAGGGGGGGGRHARASPCMAAILERERQERERQEREIRERLERERIERERKELERRERDLKAREPYMCPGQAQIEKAALKEAKKAHLAGKPLDQGGRGGNGYGELRQCAQGNGNHGYKQSPEERFGPCVPVGDLAPCDPRACPASSDKHVPLQETKSRELRGGVLYTGCDCNKRNGLQHDCKRTLCQGRPECLTKPEPMCIPSGGPGYISPCYPCL